MIRTLIADGVIVIASGGGGIPVIEDGPRLIGKEGVVDKDLAAAILATEVEASTLLILTDVKKVQRGFGAFLPEDIDRMTVAEARALLQQGRVRRRVDGTRRWRRRSGSSGRAATRAVIADLDDALAALAGDAGTEIVAA